MSMALQQTASVVGRPLEPLRLDLVSWTLLGFSCSAVLVVRRSFAASFEKTGEQSLGILLVAGLARIVGARAMRLMPANCSEEVRAYSADRASARSPCRVCRSPACCAPAGGRLGDNHTIASTKRCQRAGSRHKRPAGLEARRKGTTSATRTVVPPGWRCATIRRPTDAQAVDTPTSFIQGAEPTLPGIDGCGKRSIRMPAQVDLSALGRLQCSQDVLRGQSVDVFFFGHCFKDTNGASESFRPRKRVVPRL